jgi:hypothetical protein
MPLQHDAHNIHGASAPFLYRYHGIDAYWFSDSQAATAMEGHPAMIGNRAAQLKMKKTSALIRCN